MAGAISESEMRRRTENVGLSVQSVRLEGGDVTKAFMHDAGEYTRGTIDSASFFPAPVVVTDWSDDGACSRPVSDVFRQINLRVGIRCRFIGFLCFYGLIMPRVQQNVTGPTVLTSIEQTQ